MATVRWSRVAQRELRTLLEYMAEDSHSAAVRLRQRIGEAADRLRAFPYLGRVVPEFDDPRVRELIVGPYRLMYRLDEDGLIIVSVVHGSRDIWRHLPEGPWDIE